MVLGFTLFFFVLLSSYQSLVCRHLITTFGSSLACYDEVLFVVLLRRFICVRVIEIDKVDLISRIYEMMVVSMLKNKSRRYSSHYIIKFVDFMLLTWISTKEKKESTCGGTII